MRSANDQDDFVAVLDLGSIGDFKANSVHDGSIGAEELFEEAFSQVVQKFNVSSKCQNSVEKVSFELLQTYEELSLLYNLSSHMTVSDNDANFLQMSCDGLADIVLVEGIAIFQEKMFGDHKKLVLVAGSGLLDINEHEDRILNIVSILILVIAVISIVVGGLGIMNIMLVAVTERTKEIGVRMAIGATSRDILIQFVIEAITLCLLGGGTGIIFGAGIGAIVCSILDWHYMLTLTIVLGALFISTSIGLIFGIFPAYKASKLTPIEALRSEV